MLEEEWPPPSAWEADDAERAKQAFQAARPAVPKALVRDLFAYWLERCPDNPLFDDTEDDLALVLHARAFGLTPRGSDGGALAVLTQRALAAHVSGPLIPADLVWGPRATLAPQIRAAPAARVLRAWVAEDDRGPVDVLVVGTGLSETRREVVNAALNTSLRINGLVGADAGFVADHLGIGAIHVTAEEHEEQEVGPPVALGDRGVRASQGRSVNVRAALREFVTFLRELARKTDLVQVFVVRHEDHLAYRRSLQVLARGAARDTDRAFLKSPTDLRAPAGANAEARRVVALQPYLRTTRSAAGRAGTPIAMKFSSDLLATDSYLRLEEAHLRAFAERLIMDAKLRRDRNQADTKRLQKDLESFEQSTPEERLASWEPTVLATRRFHEETGRYIQLPEPHEWPTELYYTTVVPGLIESHRQWAERMSELVDYLETAVRRPNAPARQLAAGRFIDAALRGLVPDESTTTAAAFAAWRDEVAPMLLFEWRSALGRQGISRTDVITPHTVFVTRYLPPIEDDPATLSVGPYTIVDSAKSALLADAERGVIVVRDASDHGCGEDASDTAPDFETAWADLANLPRQSEDPAEDFSEALLALLKAHPAATARRLVETLRPEPPTPSEMAVVDEELRTAERLASVTAGMHRAVTALGNGAYLTARESLDYFHSDPVLMARTWLLRAVVECFAAGLGGKEVPEALGAGLPGVPTEALRALDKAERLDQKFTRDWLRALPDIGVGKGIRRLLIGLPRPRASCGTERRYAVWLFRHAIESARLARQLEEAADELPEDREDIDAVLVRLGRVLEDILVGPFAGGAQGDTEDLLAILTGRDQPTYGRAGAE